MFTKISARIGRAGDVKLVKQRPKTAPRSIFARPLARWLAHELEDGAVAPARMVM